MMRTAIIVQARAGSTRLPNKMFLQLGEQTVLEFLLNRLHGIPGVDDVIVATTTLPGDDAIVNLAGQLSLKVFRGDSADVLSRFQQAAGLFSSDILIRICADNPFLQPAEIDRLLTEFRHEQGTIDYLANAMPDGVPLIRTGTGLAVEVFSREAMSRLEDMSITDFHREHVTPFFYQHPNIFRRQIQSTAV